MINFNKSFFSLKWLSAFGALIIATLFTLSFFFSTDADGAKENVQYVEFPPAYITAGPIEEFPPIYITATSPED